MADMATDVSSTVSNLRAATYRHSGTERDSCNNSTLYNTIAPKRLSLSADVGLLPLTSL